MNEFGIYRVRSHVPKVRVADPEYNATQIIDALNQAELDEVDFMVFPELCVTGYTCGDLFEQKALQAASEKAVAGIVYASQEKDVFFAVGAPVEAFGKLYNCAIVIWRGQICGIVPKSYLPNYGEFYEKRWFESGKDIKKSKAFYIYGEFPFGSDLLFSQLDINVGVEICEDLWVPSPPSSLMAMAGADIILNLSASDDLIGKQDYLISLIGQQSARCRCVYAYASAGWGESSTDLVFTGKAIIAEDGKVYGGEKRFLKGAVSETRDVDIQKLRTDRQKFNTFTEKDFYSKEFNWQGTFGFSRRKEKTEFVENIDPHPFVPNDPNKRNERCKEIINIQSYGLMRRLDAINCQKAIVGISGGLDSTLALLVTVRAFDNLHIPRKNIIGVTMPGLATTSRTKNNAWQLMERLGVTPIEISIGEAVKQHFNDIGQDPAKYDATYENSQARERTQILMDLANKENGIVIGTGDMSELALGWCTYNGDHMSMYGVNASVPKTLVKYLVEWFASTTDDATSDILKDICDTPISPELVPSKNDEISQKTEDLVGPYELHDFFLYHFLRNSFSPIKIYKMAVKAFNNQYENKEIMKWLRIFIQRFFSQQFKRSCMPDGPKVGSVNLSPRGDWRMPSDASARIWLKQLDDYEKGEGFEKS